jgi:hypothetical protein
VYDQLDPQYRPMALWRWHSLPTADALNWALDQLQRQQLGGVVIAMPRPDAAVDDARAALHAAAAEGAARGLMVWAALHSPDEAGIDPANPAATAAWLAETWAPVLLDGAGPCRGLSGVLLPGACPPAPVVGQPWSPVFKEAFLDQKGYVPRRAQAAHPQVFFDIRDVHSTLIAAAWYGVAGDWCDEFQLSLMACVTDARRQDALSDAVEKYIAHVDIPAVAATLTDDIPLMCETVRSAAVLAGRRRTAVVLEQGPMWAYSLDHLKEAAERLVVAGADLLVVDGFGAGKFAGPVTTATAKREAGPGLTWQIPQWPLVHQWTGYAGRLCAIFAEGREAARVAVLKPGTSLWSLGSDAARAEAIAGQFRSLCQELHDSQIAYVLIDEAALIRMVAVNNRLFIRELWFDALIIPPLSQLQAPSIAALRRLVDQCRIFAFGAADLEIIQTDQAFLALPPQRMSLRWLERLLFTYGTTLARSDIFWRAIPRPVRVASGENIRCRYVDRGGLEWCLGVNTGEVRRTTATIDWSGQAFFWDTECEAFVPLERSDAQPGALELPLDFTEQSSVLLELYPEESYYAAAGGWICERRITIPGPWHFTPHGGNCLKLDRWPAQVHVTAPLVNCRLITPDIPETPAVLLDGQPLPFKCAESEPGLCERSIPCGADLPPADSFPSTLAAGPHTFSIHPPQQITAWLAGDFAVDAGAATPTLAPIPDMQTGPWEAHGFPHFSGRGTYTIEIEVPEGLAGTECFLYVPQVGGAVEIEVNGEVTAMRPWPPYRARVTECLRNGANLVTLTVSNTLQNQFHGPDAAHPSGLLAAPYLEFGVWSRSE